MNLLRLCFVLVAFTGLALSQNATLENLATLEAAVQQAKVNYSANANQANLDSLRQAEAAYSEFFQTLAKPERSSFLAQVAETEPNDSSGTASGPLTPGADSGTGDIEPAGDRDFWEINGLAVGEILFVTVDTGISGTGTDIEMSVFNNDGTTLLEFDDDSGDGLSSAVVAPVAVAGSAFAEINEFGDDGTIEPYEIFQFVATPGTDVAETESNDTSGTANGLASPFISGDNGDATDDFFSFGATTGDRIVVIADCDPDGDTSFTDVELTILDPDGTTVLGSEAPFTVTAQNVAIGSAANTGTHFLQLSDGGSGADTDYRFAIIVGGTPVPVELQSFSIE